MVLILGAIPAVGQTEDVTPARAGGVDRYATAAIAMNQVAFPDGTDTAIVATGADFADALAAAGLAGQANAALLLTEPDDVPQATGVGLLDLGVENVYVLGGEGAVSEDVVETFRGPGRDVARIEGEDRYGTAADVAREVAALGALPQVNGEPAAILATGEKFADAVAAGAPAAEMAAPVLLTEQDALPQATADVINELGIGHVWAIGGGAAIDDSVLTQLQDAGVQTQRIAGENRQATAAEVARTFVNSGLLDGSTITLARGDDFPDALTGGVTAAATDGPVLLTHSPDILGDATADYLASPAAAISVIRAMGGDGAVTTAVLNEAEEIAESGAATPGQQSWILAPQEALTPAAGTAVDLTLTTAPDGEPLPNELMIALFDCQVVDPTDPDRRFNDNDNDGLADGFATTGSDAAAIAVVNGNDIEDTNVVQSAQPVNGELTFRLFSGAPDCAAPVVFADTEVNGQLDVDDQGRPTEPFNVGLVTWQ